MMADAEQLIVNPSEFARQPQVVAAPRLHARETNKITWMRVVDFMAAKLVKMTRRVRAPKPETTPPDINNFTLYVLYAS